MKIKYLPSQPHSMAFGGFEIQMLGAFDACKSAGANVEKMDVWSRDSDYDILHCWGMDLYNFNSVLWAKKSGKKVVLTALLSYYETPISIIRHFASIYITRGGKYFHTMVKECDIIVVVNDKQAEILSTYFSVNKDKIRVIPNFIGKRFFDKSETNSTTKYDILKNTYALTTGNVCKRKNQVRLSKACLKSQTKLVIVGKSIEGENEYGLELEKIVANSNGNIIWIKGLSENSIELIELYRNCSIFCLPSHFEMQPISALEAVASSKPILLGKHAYANQIYYKNACLVNSNSIESIAQGIKKMKSFPEKYTVPLENINACRFENVGEEYKKIYLELMFKN